MRAVKILVGVTAVWFLWIVFLASEAGTGVLHLFSLMYGGPALGITWAITVMVVRRKPDWPAKLSRSQVGWLAVTPVCLLLAVAHEFVPQPSPLFRLRFRLSESALEREALRTLGDSERVVIFGRRVGLFAVHQLTSYRGQVRFITTACGVVDNCGVVYSPNAPPTAVSEDRFVHLRGPWWHVYEGF